MDRYIFVNTTGWLALYNPNDPNHITARALWDELRNQTVRFATTDYVMDEVYTALKVFGSLHVAQAVRELINNSGLLRLFMTDSVIFDRAWQVFMEDENPQWTYTDCVNYAVIQYLGINEVITFDPRFAPPKVSVLPGAH